MLATHICQQLCVVQNNNNKWRCDNKPKKKRGKKQGKITYQQCVCKLNVKCSQTCLYTHVYTYMYICTCMYVHTYVYVAHYCCHKISAGAHERILNILHVARNVLKQSVAAENYTTTAENKNNCK